MTIDHAREQTALARTLAAFRQADQDAVRRIVAVVFYEFEQMTIHQEGHDQTPEQRRALLVNRCCQLVGANDDVCRVVIVATREVMNCRGRE